ncbi:unnamed protein product [Larinioides sclopetarius]|uniref:Uncharacterized protein n=1 Tax=Larinioides sclopetarius TaxID=280406 RepID=A0AAV1YTT4_9ARAC
MLSRPNGATDLRKNLYSCSLKHEDGHRVGDFILSSIFSITENN